MAACNITPLRSTRSVTTRTGASSGAKRHGSGCTATRRAAPRPCMPSSRLAKEKKRQYWKAQDEAAAAAAAESDASPGEVSIHVNDARRRWAKARGFFQAYAALTAPLTQTIAESRKLARGQSLSVEYGDLEQDDLGLGISSGIQPVMSGPIVRRKSSAYRIAPPGSEM